MNAKQMLKAAGCSDTVAGKKKFYDMYPTPGHFFAKHGGELSGAPHNGQPTAAEFFAWGQPILGPQGFYAQGGDVEYNRALALVTKAMGGQAGVEMRSTNDYLQNENGYLTDYLNQGQQQFMRNGGDLKRYSPGGPNDDSKSDNSGRGGPGSLNPAQGETHEEWSRRNGIPGGGFNGGNMANLKWDGRMWSNGYNNQTENRYAPEQGTSQSTNYSDGYTGNNNQNYNPYLVNQHSFTNGFLPYMGIFGALANTAGRFGPKLKIKNKMYGNVNYYGNQQGAAGQGSSQGSSSPSAGNNGGGSSAPGQSQQNNPEGYTPYTEVIKRGIFNRLAPNKFAPKHVRAGWEKTGQGNNASANNGAPGSGTPSGGGSGAGTNAKSPYQQNTQMSPYEVFMSGQGSMPANAYPMQGANGGRYMGPDMNESDTALPQMNIQRQSPFGAGFPAMYGPQEVSSDDYSAKSNYSPFTQFTDQPVGPVNAYGMYKKGGVPRFVNGGSGTYTPDYRDQTDIYGGIGFNWNNLNPRQMEGAAQDFTGFLNNGQNQRIMNQQRNIVNDPLNTTADLEYKGNQRTLDSNLVSNTRETGQRVNSAGESNVDGQIGMSRYGGTMQGGGQVNINDEIDMDEDELEQFLANGGQVEYL